MNAIRDVTHGVVVIKQNGFFELLLTGVPIPIQNRQHRTQCDVSFRQHRIQRRGLDRRLFHPRTSFTRRLQPEHRADQQRFSQCCPDILGRSELNYPQPLVHTYEECVARLQPCGVRRTLGIDEADLDARIGVVTHRQDAQPRLAERRPAP